MTRRISRDDLLQNLCDRAERGESNFATDTDSMELYVTERLQECDNRTREGEVRAREIFNDVNTEDPRTIIAMNMVGTIEGATTMLHEAKPLKL